MTPEQIQYVITELARGVDEDTLRANLAAAGYQPQLIEELLATAQFSDASGLEQFPSQNSGSASRGMSTGMKVLLIVGGFIFLLILMAVVIISMFMKQVGERTAVINSVAEEYANTPVPVSSVGNAQAELAVSGYLCVDLDSDLKIYLGEIMVSDERVGVIRREQKTGIVIEYYSVGNTSETVRYDISWHNQNEVSKYSSFANGHYAGDFESFARGQQGVYLAYCSGKWQSWPIDDVLLKPPIGADITEF